MPTLVLCRGNENVAQCDCNDGIFMVMSSVVLDLEQTLTRLDDQSAALLEQLVRDALALVDRQGKVFANNPLDPMGWPVGFFQKYVGCLAGEDWQPPSDPPAEPSPAW
jgi:hypothetical protein